MIRNIKGAATLIVVTAAAKSPATILTNPPKNNNIVVVFKIVNTNSKYPSLVLITSMQRVATLLQVGAPLRSGPHSAMHSIGAVAAARLSPVQFGIGLFASFSLIAAIPAKFPLLPYPVFKSQ
jgi:hypothetical protein